VKNFYFDPKTSIELFKYFLYKDADFTKRAKEFSEWLYSAVPEDERIILLLTVSKDCPLKGRLKDKYGVCKGVTLIEDTAKRFEVPEYVIEYGFIKHPEIRGVSESAPIIFNADNQSVSIANDEMVLKIFTNTRLKDIEKIWGLVNRMQMDLKGYKPQSQSTSFFKLIYAIYKQRLPDRYGKRKPFSAIFDLYQGGTLPGYKGSTTQFKSDHSLAAKYRQFMPKSNEL
jgi:hypothetical protein